MKTPNDPKATCAGCPLSRRRFLSTASAGALGALAAGSLLPACAASPKTRVRVIYALHDAVQPGPDWPNVGFDFRPVMERTTAGVGRALPGGEVLASLPLPIAGLLSDEPLETVVRQLSGVETAAAALGCALASPFSTLSFLALPVIPQLRLTDLGLVDVGRFELLH